MPKTVGPLRILNISVLSRMPRDYTAHPILVVYRCIVPPLFGGIQYMNKTAKMKVAKSTKLGKGKERAPVAVSTVVSNGAPQMESYSNGDVLVCHTEYIGDIISSIAFTSNAFPVNPGIVRSFPWLSGLATRFESYRFESLSFSLKTLSPTSATGSVVMAVDYDASDPAPVSKIQTMSYRSASRGAPWQDLSLMCLREDLHKMKTYFVRAQNLPDGDDLKLYDVGNLFVATQGQASATAPTCELYVSYRCRLMTPQLGASEGRGIGATATAGMSNVLAFGTDFVYSPASTVSADINATGQSLTFRENVTGLLVYTLTGTAINNGVATAGSTVTITGGQASVSGTTSTTLVWRAWITATVGQFLRLQITAATYTNNNWWFVPAPLALSSF